MWIVTAEIDGKSADVFADNDETRAITFAWGLLKDGCSVKLRREPCCAN